MESGRESGYRQGLDEGYALGFEDGRAEVEKALARGLDPSAPEYFAEADAEEGNTNANIVNSGLCVTDGEHIYYSAGDAIARMDMDGGGVTAFCGPIGFVGIAVPHICRIIFRTADQRVLLAGSILAGATVMPVSELITLLPGNGMVLPINSVTAFIGIPVIIWIIVRNHRMASLM
jgi:hypothetical protein